MNETIKSFSEKQLKKAAEELINKLGFQCIPTLDNVAMDDFFRQNDFSFKYMDDVKKCIEHIWEIGYVNYNSYNQHLDDIENKYLSLEIFACEINANAKFSRTMAANLTRAFNRINTRNYANRQDTGIDIPVIVIIKQGNLLSIATCERSNRKDRTGDKIGKVTMLRNMNCEKLHPGHRQILERIANEVSSCSRYDELYQKWFKSFSIDVLSDEFFEGYKTIYEDIIEFVTGKRMVKKSGKWVEQNNGKPCVEIMEEFAEFGDPEKAVRDYVKKLMGRLTFIQFLQKKGWMGVPNGSGWGEGDPEFLQHLFEKTEKKETFIDDVLKPLFDDLNKKRNNDLVTNQNLKVDNIDIKVPYLNGGLFESDKSDEFSFHLPSHFIKELLDFFASYNFTIDENAPDNVEVGVDPEMLGRIFENLLEDNKDKGAYYTPKEVVQYMCKESIISYLQNDFSSEHRKAIREFVSTYKVDVLPKEIVEEIDRRLANIKICDPAIGSGAFPMGMLKELLFCRCAIENFEKSAEIKKHIIQENIYGVDIEKGAVDIARLRFWLSLVVEEKDPEVLPNLDYKIMQGNSLFTTFNSRYINISNNQNHKNAYKIRQKKEELSKKQKEYFEQVGNKKLETSIEIKTIILDIVALQLGYELEAWASASAIQGSFYDDMQKETISMQEIKKVVTGEKKEVIKLGEKLRKTLNDSALNLEERAKTDLLFFDWKVMFSDVFEQGGFDVVIGNPPYGAKLSEDDKTIIRRFYNTTKTRKLDIKDDSVYLEYIGNEYKTKKPTPSLKGSMDTYTLFIELAYWLLRKDAFMSFIIPISFTSSDSLSALHKLLLEKCKEIKVSSYSVRPQPVFKNAVVNTSILMFQKTLTPCQQLLSTKMHRKSRDFDLQNLMENQEFIDVADCLKMMGRVPKIGLKKEKDILKKIWSLSPLSKYVEKDGKPIYYRTTGGRYFKIVTNYSTSSKKEKAICFNSRLSDAIGCILSSNLSFWYYQIISNNLDWKSEELLSFTIPNLSNDNINKLCALYKKYLDDVEANANVRQSSGNSKYTVEQFKEYKIVKSKSIIDEIDDYIYSLYGLTQEECDFIKKYELEFRMAGDE